MSVSQRDFVSSIAKLNSYQKPSDFVINPPSLKEVERALEEKDVITIRVVGLASLSIGEQTPEEVQLGEDGKGFMELDAKLAIHERTLKSIQTLTREPDGSFSFIGTEHTTYTWERNYNAGYQTNHTYTTYKISVDAIGRGTYEVQAMEKTI